MSTIKSSAENLTLNADGANNDIKFQSNGSEVAAIDQAGNLTLSGTVDGVDVAAAGALATNSVQKSGGSVITSNLDFNDNVIAKFGTGGDLQISHDGTTSLIRETNASGDFHIQGKEIVMKMDNGENSAIFRENGGVELMHNAVEKFKTIADGVQINGNIEIGTNPFAITGEGGSDRLTIQENTGNVWIDGNCSAASFTDRTPYPETLQLAYDVINSHQKLPDGPYNANDHSKQLDHSQLNDYVKEEDNNRNMSGVISCLVEVVKDLSAKITALENA